MSAALFVSVDRDVPGVGPAGISGKALARHVSKLNRRARDLGLRPPEDFVSADPEDVRDLLGGDEADDLPDLPPEEWFDPADGLATVRGLIRAVEDEPKAFPDAALLADDLRTVERMLELAAAAGARFHFTYDI